MEICISISASTPAEYRDALNALNAGIQAVRDAAPGVKIMLHLDLSLIHI